jgi:hypothetical protein
MRLKILLCVAAVLGIVLAAQLVFGKRAAASVLGYTTCPLFGEPRVSVSLALAPEDTLPVRRHEEVHAAQCRELGPLRFRLRNLTERGKLALEAPGYCAGARGRIAQRMDTASVRERLLDDAQASFPGLDTGTVRTALRASCPDLGWAAAPRAR